MPRTAPEVIKENKAFRRLYSRGRTQVHPLLVTYARKNRDGKIRYGISASKKIGGAVQRNRAKRVIRAALREAVGSVPQGWDFIFVARGRTTRVKMEKVRAVMEQQLAALTGAKQEPVPKSGGRKGPEGPQIG